MSKVLYPDGIIPVMPTFLGAINEANISVDADGLTSAYVKIKENTIADTTATGASFKIRYDDTANKEVTFTFPTEYAGLTPSQQNNLRVIHTTVSDDDDKLADGTANGYHEAVIDIYTNTDPMTMNIYISNASQAVSHWVDRIANADNPGSRNESHTTVNGVDGFDVRDDVTIVGITATYSSGAAGTDTFDHDEYIPSASESPYYTLPTGGTDAVTHPIQSNDYYHYVARIDSYVWIGHKDETAADGGAWYVPKGVVVSFCVPDDHELHVKRIGDTDGQYHICEVLA